MHYGSGLAKTGAGAIVVGGISFTPLWQLGIALGVVMLGALTIKFAHKIRHN